MRAARIALFVVVLSLPLFVAPGASALDLCEEPHCQPPAAEHNTPYEWEFVAEEGCVPYTFKHTNGALPVGLEVTVDGKLKGTPTEAGDFDFWVTLNDNGGPHNPACLIKGTESQSRFFLHVRPDLAVTTESLPVATPGQPYSVQLQFSNPEIGWPVIWDITQGSLPIGLSLSENGVISGTPAGADVRQLTVRAREPFRRFGERQLTIVVATKLTAAAPARALGEVGVRFARSLRASGGAQPITWAIESGELPAGLSLNVSTGAVRGTPRAAGSSALTFSATDTVGQKATVSTTFRIVARLTIATLRLPSAVLGESYRARVRSVGGLAPKRWTIVRGKLPRGIVLDRASGALSGVVRAPGTNRITVRVTDRLGATATKTLTLGI